MPTETPRSSNALGEFLRARRGQVRPEDVGITSVGHRRTPGLRREEVATFAGISTDYYLRPEQGPDRTPSTQVLESIGRVLQLDEDEMTCLLAPSGRDRWSGADRLSRRGGDAVGAGTFAAGEHRGNERAADTV